ncbi:ochratoxin A non-ribosomal peptide synthetase [Pyrenophora tritici-repentis Pt-1C-BFP]|uniref:Ochratoxin A non-ribosomal peptide synthetase n=1 Tax=Pyrenophora tritici-repentis (strain Pt-1C-BFP) TaxID=426418 RepID=B2W5Z2_PYRTR|nr:ochratoxin A non-ribosomal peptide synthetase [Pyrenophora tritici-repentis Pt-1C-BFP]EDU49070.1 ochratoxin A non-ribosomal peptide synthetase [Pyrenophora tritici-repentis Pt-1C-BFP]
MYADRITDTLAPEIVKLRARNDPNGVFAQIPAGTTYSDGFRSITNLQLYNAINYTAGLIRQRFGESKEFETLAFIGPSDPRYTIMLMAAMITGYKAFLPSPRNSEEAHLTLLERLQCHKIVVTESPLPCVGMILKGRKMQTLTLPELGQLLDVGDVEEYLYTKTFEEAKRDPVHVLHTSGTTGIPKPLIYTPAWAASLMVQCQLEAPEGFVDLSCYTTRGRFVSILPPFHGAGVTFTCFVALFFGTVPVFMLPGLPPTTEDMVQAISHADVDWAFLPPAFVDELGKRPDLLDVAAIRLKYIAFGGGATPKRSGDVVAKRIPLWQILGSSEAGSIPLMHVHGDNTEDWNYMRFNPVHKFEMRHCYDDLHELVIPRDKSSNIQAVFEMFPDTEEFRSKDLFKPHPTKEGLWIYHSRDDDIIVFLNGEKTNPVTFEEEVISHPEVKAALVIGAQREEAALLVELASTTPLSDEEKTAAVNRIWSVVEQANKFTPAHARIAKSRILLVDPETPMVRTGKGTVQRKATLKLYAAKIDKLYQQEDEVSSALKNGTRPTKSIIRDVVAEMLDLDNLDFFKMGMDSLGALRLRRALQRHFPTANIPNNIAYTNSSVNAIATAVEKLSAPTTTTTNGVTLYDHPNPNSDLSGMLQQYIAQINTVPPPSPPSFPSPTTPTILLTGSTGALGSHILTHLLTHPSSPHIICVNRTSSAPTRQLALHKTRSLPTTFPPERVTFLTADLSLPSFGLLTETYADLLDRVTHIIHNAWPVNFNLPLSSFAASVAGVVGLVSFAASSKYGARVQFLSSIGSVAGVVTARVPEQIITDLSAPARMGYAQSKYVSERLLAHACETLGVSASVVRLGQIAGAAESKKGWNRWEWLPSLVASSGFVGALPRTLGKDEGSRADWVPVDHLADVVCELALWDGDGEGKGEVRVNHIVHPIPTPWADLLPVIQRTLSSSSSRTQVSIIPYAEWVALLKQKTAESEKDTELDHEALAMRNPAMKLLDFYEGLLGEIGARTLGVELDMQGTLGESETLRTLEPLKGEWVEGWVQEWMSETVG